MPTQTAARISLPRVLRTSPMTAPAAALIDVARAKRNDVTHLVDRAQLSQSARKPAPRRGGVPPRLANPSPGKPVLRMHLTPPRKRGTAAERDVRKELDRRYVMQRIHSRNPAAAAHLEKAERASQAPSVGSVLLDADQHVGFGLSATGQAMGAGWDWLWGHDGDKAASEDADRLAQLRQAKFEGRLAAQSPARAERYHQHQQQAGVSIRADSDPETWRLKEVRRNEEETRQVLARTPTGLNPAQQARIQAATDSIVEGSSARKIDEVSWLLAMREQERACLAQSDLSRIGPEKRRQLEAAERSALASGMQSSQHSDVIKDVLTMGASSASKTDGVRGAVLELSTLGLHGQAKNGAQELGRGIAYGHSDDRTLQAEGKRLKRSGGLQVALAVVGGLAAAGEIHGALKGLAKSRQPGALSEGTPGLAPEPPPRMPQQQVVPDPPEVGIVEFPTRTDQALDVPQGLSVEQFQSMSRLARNGTRHIGEDARVHGSRAAGTARPDSDIDLAVRVPAERFEELVRQRFKTPNPGSAKERTMQHAIVTGKIQAGEAGLSRLAKAIKKEIGLDVDLSILRVKGPFDQGPWIPLAK